MLILLLYLHYLDSYNWNIIKLVMVILLLKDIILRYVRYSVGVFLGALHFTDGYVNLSHSYSVF